MSRLDYGRLCAVDSKQQQGEQRYSDAFPESSEPWHIPVPAVPRDARGQVIAGEGWRMGDSRPFRRSAAARAVGAHTDFGSARQGPPRCVPLDAARPPVALRPSPFGPLLICPIALSCSAAHSMFCPMSSGLWPRRSDPRAGCSQAGPRPRMGLHDCSLARAHQEVCVRGGGGAADGRRVGRCGAAGQAHAAAGSDSGGLSCPLHSPRAVWARTACPRRRTELSVGSTGQSAERSACRILR